MDTNPKRLKCTARAEDPRPVVQVQPVRLILVSGDHILNDIGIQRWQIEEAVDGILAKRQDPMIPRRSKEDIKMTINMGSVDRAVRFVVGILLLILPFLTDFAIWQSMWVTGLAVLVGLVMLGTSLSGNCPAYTLLGIKTRQP